MKPRCAPGSSRHPAAGHALASPDGRTGQQMRQRARSTPPGAKPEEALPHAVTCDSQDLSAERGQPTQMHTAWQSLKQGPPVLAEPTWGQKSEPWG